MINLSITFKSNFSFKVADNLNAIKNTINKGRIKSTMFKVQRDLHLQMEIAERNDNSGRVLLPTQE
jgi:hypothetical protein